MRATILEVARQAGVSAATVDRVLNNRPGVKARTREIVFDVARKVGYLPAEHANAETISGERIRLDFVLPIGTNSFIRMLLDQLGTQGAARPGLDVHVHAIEGFNPDTLATTLRDLGEKTLGVGVVALDHPTVREAIRALSTKDIKVVTLATDVLHVPRIAYVGIDNRQAGRLAGYLLGRLLGTDAPKKIALFAGSLSYRGHQEREMGFRHVLGEEFPNLSIVELREMLDDRERAYSEASSILDQHPDLAGIYNIGAGNQGIAAAMRERGREHSTLFVGHELTEGAKRLLLDGTMDAVIDQNPRVEAREALNLLTHAIRGLPYESHPPRLHLVLKENIPEV
ncbi:LacI family DNA-binding transcriptional regulator [Mesorhizobium sp. CN2-181]|uniref:LacI family DNA-binding transcriptional regulator n=1 Tax=Mesorhizobium yinganensis TaxID=3157707 RepID=UPI0032B727A2